MAGEQKSRRAAVRAPAGAAAKLAGLAREVIEAQVFRQLMTAAELDDAFARHVVDDRC
jgi:hypothetical protein